jgi:hypothetical protein
VIFRSGTAKRPEEQCESDSRDVSLAMPDLSAIWNEIMGLKDLVENEHDRKLRRIESDLRWTMMLVGAQFITIIGSAIATLVGG